MPSIASASLPPGAPIARSALVRMLKAGLVYFLIVFAADSPGSVYLASLVCFGVAPAVWEIRTALGAS